MINERLSLSVGRAHHRLLGVVVGLIFALAGVAFVVLPMFVASMFEDRTPGVEVVTGDPDDLPDFPGMPDLAVEDAGFDFGNPILLIGLIGLPFIAFGSHAAVRALRYSAWLVGTRAYVRGAFRTRSADLATAAISTGAVTYRHDGPGPHDSIHRIPTIVALDANTGQKVTIPLRGAGLALLPPAQLRALASAMTVGRPIGEQHRTAHAFADRLRQLADDPLAV
jgi:hypothetical protein